MQGAVAMQRLTDFASSVDSIIWKECRRKATVTNESTDAGGLTKYGISKRANPDLDIADLTLEEVEQCYKDRYWKLIRGDALPIQIAHFVFDCAVNQGVGTAVKLMQRTLGVTADGAIGTKTLAAAMNCNVDDFLDEFCALRAKRYAENSKEQIEANGKGWFRRLVNTYNECKTGMVIKK